jgi:hypothetical protein
MPKSGLGLKLATSACLDRSGLVSLLHLFARLWSFGSAHTCQAVLYDVLAPCNNPLEKIRSIRCKVPGDILMSRGLSMMPNLNLHLVVIPHP